MRGDRLRRQPRDNSSPQHVGSRRVQQVVLVQRAGHSQTVHQHQAALRPFAHADRGGSIEQHDRRRIQFRELGVERSDLRPIGPLRACGLRMQGGDRCLDLVRARGAQMQCKVDERETFVDLLPIPHTAILLLQCDQGAAGVDTSVTTRVVEEHQREQPGSLGVLRIQLAQQPREADCFGAQFAPHEAVAAGGQISLVEYEIDDRLHRRAPLRQRVLRWYLVRNARVLILRFARTNRCASVVSGKRNERAISSVVRPPSVRSVSATCASRFSAGWQHVKISRSRSSGSPAAASSNDTASAKASSPSASRSRSRFSRRVRSRRAKSMSLR